MKNLPKTLGLVVLLLIINNLNAQELPFVENCVGYWPFSENANDESGNNINGTPSGAILSSDRFENENNSYSFDGIDDYIDFGENPNFNFSDYTKPFTISFWANSSKVENSTFISIGSEDYKALAISNQSKKLSFIFSTGGGWHIFSSNDTWIINIWKHVAIVNNGNGLLSMYIDGTLDGTFPILNNIVLNDLQFKVGGHYRLHDNYYCKGKIDEILVYNKSLTDSEILTLYNGYIPPVQCSYDWECENNILYYNNGQVIIGTDDLDINYKFGVNGKIKTKEVLVTLTDWPDHVFKNDYKLNPLNQLENYISINKHLPNIPSEKEVKEDGVSLGEMNAKLLEKIEELTLYIIEQNKKTEKLELKLEQIEKKNIILENKNSELENRIVKIESTD